MAAITSSSPPHLSATNPPVTDSRNILHEAVPRPLITTGSVLTMYPQASSPLRAYPEPIPSESQMPGDPSYFTTEQRPQQQSLSQEDQNLANSLSHDMNGQMSALSPQMSNGQAQNFGITGQGGMPPTPQQPPGAPPMAGQHSGVDPNQELSYGVGSDRRKRSKVSRACDECRRKKVFLGNTLSLFITDSLSQVRCDSTTSDGNIIEKCSNCRRLKTTCQFERAPMKRGPSKGYLIN